MTKSTLFSQVPAFPLAPPSRQELTRVRKQQSSGLADVLGTALLDILPILFPQCSLFLDRLLSLSPCGGHLGMRGCTGCLPLSAGSLKHGKPASTSLRHRDAESESGTPPACHLAAQVSPEPLLHVASAVTSLQQVFQSRLCNYSIRNQLRLLSALGKLSVMANADCHFDRI